MKSPLSSSRKGSNIDRAQRITGSSLDFLGRLEPAFFKLRSAARVRVAMRSRRRVELKMRSLSLWRDKAWLGGLSHTRLKLRPRIKAARIRLTGSQSPTRAVGRMEAIIGACVRVRHAWRSIGNAAIDGPRARESIAAPHRSIDRRIALPRPCIGKDRLRGVARAAVLPATA